MFNTPDEFIAFMKRFTDDCSYILASAKKKATETSKSLSECLDEAAMQALSEEKETYKLNTFEQAAMNLGIGLIMSTYEKLHGSTADSSEFKKDLTDKFTKMFEIRHDLERDGYTKDFINFMVLSNVWFKNDRVMDYDKLKQIDELAAIGYVIATLQLLTDTTNEDIYKNVLDIHSPSKESDGRSHKDMARETLILEMMSVYDYFMANHYLKDERGRSMESNREEFRKTLVDRIDDMFTFYTEMKAAGYSDYTILKVMSEGKWELKPLIPDEAVDGVEMSGPSRHSSANCKSNGLELEWDYTKSHKLEDVVGLEKAKEIREAYLKHVEMMANKEREAAKTPPTVLEETLRLIPVDKIANIEISVGADGFTTVDVEMKGTPTDDNTIGAVYMDEFPVFTTPESSEDDNKEEIPIKEVDACLDVIKINTEFLIRTYPNKNLNNDDYKQLHYILEAATRLKSLLLEEDDDNNG